MEETLRKVGMEGMVEGGGQGCLYVAPMSPEVHHGWNLHEADFVVYLGLPQLDRLPYDFYERIGDQMPEDPPDYQPTKEHTEVDVAHWDLQAHHKDDPADDDPETARSTLQVKARKAELKVKYESQSVGEQWMAAVLLRNQNGHVVVMVRGSPETLKPNKRDAEEAAAALAHSELDHWMAHGKDA
jgi:hypothetical protein